MADKSLHWQACRASITSPFHSGPDAAERKGGVSGHFLCDKTAWGVQVYPVTRLSEDLRSLFLSFFYPSMFGIKHHPYTAQQLLKKKKKQDYPPPKKNPHLISILYSGGMIPCLRLSTQQRNHRRTLLKCSLCESTLPASAR